MDPTILKITIVCVSYRDKRVVETFKMAYDNAFDKSSINLAVSIQDSHNHKIQTFNEGDIVRYHLWDQNMGFAKIRSNLIDTVSKDSYVLFVSSATIFKENWDLMLRSWVKENPHQILSIENEKFSVSGALINSNTLKDVGYPDYLRLMGEEADMSIRLYAKGYEIFNGINSVIEILEEKEYDYIPFSKTHHYNEVYDLYQNAKNKYIDLSNFKEKCLDYASKHPIKKIYHQLDDVLYFDYEVGELDDFRFFNHGSRI